MDDFAHIVGEDVHFRGRSPPGERGLKFPPLARQFDAFARRSPPGERGLKSWQCRQVADVGEVAPHPGSVD